MFWGFSLCFCGFDLGLPNFLLVEIRYLPCTTAKIIHRVLWDSNGRLTLPISFNDFACSILNSNIRHWLSYKRPAIFILTFLDRIAKLDLYPNLVLFHSCKSLLESNFKFKYLLLFQKKYIVMIEYLFLSFLCQSYSFRRGKKLGSLHSFRDVHGWVWIRFAQTQNQIK